MYTIQVLLNMVPHNINTVGVLYCCTWYYNTRDEFPASFASKHGWVGGLL